MEALQVGENGFVFSAGRLGCKMASTMLKRNLSWCTLCLIVWRASRPESILETSVTSKSEIWRVCVCKATEQFCDVYFHSVFSCTPFFLQSSSSVVDTPVSPVLLAGNAQGLPQGWTKNLGCAGRCVAVEVRLYSPSLWHCKVSSKNLFYSGRNSVISPPISSFSVVI